ncbi:MAG: carboxypeptidase regulatory-like domain-containing protein, partial [Bacteroidetes bacterium]|nr:carboxypeptidase regulatory-like domain-containing protein [Bacteroidota bacterium]
MNLQQLEARSTNTPIPDLFDYLDFDIRAKMPLVTIMVEKAVRIRGKVVDPDGKPVAGATVAPANGRTNSIT